MTDEYKVIKVPQKWWDYGPGPEAVEQAIKDATGDGWELVTAMSSPAALGFYYVVMLIFRRAATPQARA
jgi:hypothetical protein